MGAREKREREKKKIQLTQIGMGSFKLIMFVKVIQSGRDLLTTLHLSENVLLSIYDYY